MKFSLEIKTGNDAVRGLVAISTLLKKLADKIKRKSNEPDSGKILDANGNTVGTWSYDMDD